MKCKKLSLFVLSFLTAASFSQAQAQLEHDKFNITTTKNTEIMASSVAELVLAIDDSGSMRTSAADISDAMVKVVEDLTCDSRTVYVKAHLVGIEDPFIYGSPENIADGKTFNRNFATLVKDLGITPPSIREDDYVLALRNIANYYPYHSAIDPRQEYVKVAVVIGDGGRYEYVGPTYLTSIQIANKAAFDKGIVSFAIRSPIGSFPGTDTVMKALVGEAQHPADPTHTYLDTGGGYVEYDTAVRDTDKLEADLRELICKAMQRASVPEASIPLGSVPATPPLGLIFLTMMISVAGFFGIRKWKLK